MICLSCGTECQTAHHWDGAKSYKEWICGDCKVKELADRLAKAEKERDELKRPTGCGGCVNEVWVHTQPRQCYDCIRKQGVRDYFKPRDPSAEQGGGK